MQIAKHSPYVGEVIVVSDGSTDATAREAREAGADVVVELAKNAGKGGAIWTGIREAKFEAILLLDADLVGLTEAHIESLVKPVLDGTASITVGVSTSDDLQKRIWQTSGQRALAKELILNHPDLANSGFRFEILLNRYAKKEKRHVVRVGLRNLEHVLKREKYGRRLGFKMSSRAGWDMGKKALKNLVQAVIALAGIWLYLTVFAPYLGKYPLSYPVLAPAEAGDRILVIAAHPDDEVLGAAGYVADAVGRGAQAWFVVVTNGDANIFSAVTSERLVVSKSRRYIDEGNMREKESLAGIAQLGIAENHVFFLGFPDKGLAEIYKKHWSRANPYRSPYTQAIGPPYDRAYNLYNVYSGEDLLADLVEIIEAVKPTKIFIHSTLDTHPDHRTTAEFSHRALAAVAKKADFPQPQIRSFLIHYGDFPRPVRYEPNNYLLPPRELTQKLNWVTFPLSEAAENMKLAAVEQYKSQLTSPFLDFLLKSFVRKNELFINE